MSRYETRFVLAGAYLFFAEEDTLLAHAVEVDAAGNDVRVLCGRVKLASLADPGATDPGEEPTCKRCVVRMTREHRAKGGGA